MKDEKQLTHVAPSLPQVVEPEPLTHLLLLSQQYPPLNAPQAACVHWQDPPTQSSPDAQETQASPFFPQLPGVSAVTQ